MNIKQICSQASATIERRDIELLLAYALRQPRSYLYAHPETELTPPQLELFYQLLQRYQQGEPVVYILGETEFYSLKFSITPAVLAPRPETELLVNFILDNFKQDNLSVLELGTGSGVIAITLAKHRPRWTITATDISDAALEIAHKNADFHNINNMTFIKSDWYSELSKEKYDLIVSNPPYIADDDHHLKSLLFEPILALTSGNLGMDAIGTIIKEAKFYLQPGGWILLEHGYQQAELVQKCFLENHFTEVKTKQDLSGHPRVTIAKNN